MLVSNVIIFETRSIFETQKRDKKLIIKHFILDWNFCESLNVYFEFWKTFIFIKSYIDTKHQRNHSIL